MYDVIIVGAGPAGLTSALYLARANKKVLVLEAKSYGGQIINSSKVENYPGIDSISGFDFATNLYNQVIKYENVEIKYETVIKIDENKHVYTTSNEYDAAAVILATGVTNKKLNLPNEDKFIGNGVSYCATCDGNFFKNKIVAINGGGSRALEDALYLSKLVSKLYIIHRRNEFTGDIQDLEELQKSDNVEFITNVNIVSLNGNDILESITLDNGNTIEVNGLFVAIGTQPNNQMFNNVVELDEKGFFISEDGVHTKINCIYIAGDARTKYLRQLTTAVSDGAIAATTALKEMKKDI